jgi:hypothetical protein
MPKLAFLFLTIGPLFHEQYWENFFKGHEQCYTIYIHAKQDIPTTSPFKPFQLTETISTSWEHTIKAQQRLLQEALKDPDNQKFIFLSESTIPLRDFYTVYQRVFATEKSLFTYFPNPHQQPGDPRYFSRSLNCFPRKFRYKNWQWIILNRRHAYLMACDQKIIEYVALYQCDNELYAATFLSILGMLDQVESIDTTYVNWNRKNPPAAQQAYPFIFTDLHANDQLKNVLDAIDTGYLFARKFAAETDLSPLDCYLTYRKPVKTY